MSSEWSQFFGYNYPNDYMSCFSNSELLNKAEQFLEDKKEDSQHRVYNNLDVFLKVIESHTEVRDNIVILAKVPMVVILTTFLISIISLVFIDLYFSSCLMNYLGMTIVLTMIVLITFSMTCILKFFFISIRIGKGKI